MPLTIRDEGQRERASSQEGSPFHAGEQQVQTRLGVREEIEPWARRVVRPYLPDGHRAFYAGLPYLVIAARDAEGRPWATMLAGAPGFVTSPDPQRLRVEARPSPGDALASGWTEGSDVGVLGIELSTRRRNRVNGRLARTTETGFELAVDQSFGNCPQHITERSAYQEPMAARPSARRGTSLSARQRRLVERADTFFLATGHRAEGDEPSFGMDASHRGGSRGFVTVRDARHLVFPDYAGNNHFNTLGNLVLDPRIGLLFVDFEQGHLLQLTGRAEIDWGSHAVRAFPGAQRLVAVEIEEVVELRAALPLRFRAPAGSVRELRLVEKRAESHDVTSFVFEARDGGALPPFAPGQHLPLELEVPGVAAPVTRTYSLSGAPSRKAYRISVKREPQGQASRQLHDRVEVGDVLAARAPRGAFVLEDSERPVVLVSAGIGLTPLLSMLHALAVEGERSVAFVHGARDGDHHPLREEVEALVASHPQARMHVAYSRPGTLDVPGRDYHSEGRVDAELLEKLVPGLDADFYLCGPSGFLAAIEEGLEARGVPSGRIHRESFGAGGR